jgi:hypothetical protein
MDPIMNEDLSKAECIASLMNLAMDGARKLLEEGDDEGWEDVRKIIMKDVPTVVECDRQPAAQMFQQKLKNAAKYPMLAILFGGFHVLLTCYKALGCLFGFCFLRGIFGCWRRTKGQLDYVLKDPGDPNQISEETIMVLHALYVSASYGLMNGFRNDKPRNAPKQLRRLLSKLTVCEGIESWTCLSIHSRVQLYGLSMS